MSSRGGARGASRGGARGGARGGGRGGAGARGRGGARGGGRGGSKPSVQRDTNSPAVFQRAPEEERREQELRRLEEDRERIETERREEKERRRRQEIDTIQQEEVRKRAAEVRRKQEEEAARRAREEATRREKVRLEEQRRRQEENLRRQREAVMREEQERSREHEQMQQKLRSDRDAALQSLANEKAERARLEALRKEVESRQVASPLKRKADTLAKPAQCPRLMVARHQRRHAAGFQPESELDYQVLDIYSTRQPVEGNLPPVVFTKKSEGLYFLGQRKCLVEVVSGVPQVKLGQQYGDLQTWIEKTEKVEALRIRGMASAKNVLNIQQATGFVF